MIRYWNFTDISLHTGVPSVALRQRQYRGTMPAPDAEIGTMPGWLPATIESWWAGKGKEEEQAVEYLTTAQAAALCGVAERTLQSWRGAGKGPTSVKLGNLVRYRRADVDAWIEGGRGV